MPRISIVRCTGAVATGTSASMPAIRTATTSTSDAPCSTLHIEVLTHGTYTAPTAITIAIATTSVLPEAHTSACTTAGIAVTSVTITEAQ